MGAVVDGLGHRPEYTTAGEGEGPVTRGYITADEVRHALIDRITTGVYPAGDPLPSHRRLAEDLGANRNTIQKACRSLVDQGVLESVPGQRATIVRRVPGAWGVGELVRERMRGAIWQAMIGGMPRERLLEEVVRLVDDVYSTSGVRIWFAECNAHESAALAAELGRLLGMSVEAGLVSELGQPGRWRQAHLLVTTFHHLAEASALLGDARERLVGVDTRLAPATALGIARLAQPRIGLVCTLASTAASLRYVILSYLPGRQIDVALIDAADDVARIAATCGHLVVTHNCVAECARITPRRPDVVIEFTIEPQSMDYLRQRIALARRAAGR